MAAAARKLLAARSDPGSPGSWKTIPRHTAIRGVGVEAESVAAACAAATEERNAAARAQRSAADMSTGGGGGASTLADHISCNNNFETIFHSSVRYASI
jgi:hypothetical protein